ncbi:MAG: CRISPR-associated protein Csx16 [Candidatus Polarisedimenticolaceae bacterium]|nr:CRISPR-associated protein Csx16 [Candidatus Polarisedimenticolaceae bacterium]
MTTYFVTRHQGAVNWAKQQGIKVDQQTEHLDPGQIKQGDTIIGSLPVNLAADICRRGGRYLHLSLDLPQKLRGQELTAEDMIRCNARIEEFTIIRKP